MPTIRQVVEAVREEMHELLQAKTGWGRNEVELILEKAISNALARFVRRKRRKGRSDL